jgi:hypothetical protein
MSGASDRLARSRLAIIEHVHRKEVRKDRSARRAEPAPRSNEGAGEQWEAAQAAAASSGSWFTRAKRAARSYWRHHPARMGLQVAEPVLSRYAHKNPAAYVTAAAVAGAIIMVARPWRLVSVTGVLVALAKSPQLAGLVMSTMSGSDWDDDTS